MGALSPYYRESSLSTVRFCPEGIKTAEVEGKGIGVIASKLFESINLYVNTKDNLSASVKQKSVRTNMMRTPATSSNINLRTCGI